MNKPPSAQRSSRLFYFAAAAAVLALPSAAIAQNVTVRVTVQNTDWFNCGDGLIGGPPEIYFAVTIDGFRQDNRENAIESNLSPFPVDQELSHQVDITLGTVPIVIEQWDDDGGLTFDDDQCDIGDAGESIEFDLDLTACAVSGEITGSCGATFTSRGVFVFTVNVEEPPSAPGLNVRCIHDPIWPQPGETVTITANSLDGVLGSRVSDAIEIWVNNQTTPSVSMPGTTATFTAGPFPDPTFTYGCRVVDDGLVAWTGWRTVAVGQSDITNSFGRIPILFTGSRSSRIDLVFYPDVNSYTGGDDPAFIDDVGNAISSAYHREEIFLTNQDAVNYWLSVGTGNADGCDSEVSQTSWEDAGALLHVDEFRDCAPGGGRFFTAEPTSFGTMIHETGHRPFGLADEYCCDGGYFQADPFPNMYFERAPTQNFPLACENDAPAAGNLPSDCHEVEEEIPWWFNSDWYTSDPVSSDLMVDRGPHRNLDNRRFNWLFQECRGSGC
jgi:hypothetical protein